MKPLHEVTDTDERQQFFAGGLADLHGELAAITLNSQVPENVRDLFDTAINLSLYSWYVYDFHPIADMTGFLALEAALKARAVSEPKLEKKRLAELMDHAVASGWLSDERMNGREDIARTRVQDRKIDEARRRADAMGLV